jgi:hypothetical protein
LTLCIADLSGEPIGHFCFDRLLLFGAPQTREFAVALIVTLWGDGDW